MDVYNRYTKFTKNGAIDIVPFIEIPVKDSDKYIYYRQGKDRLDIISHDFYGDSNYGWLILQANPEAGSMEFNIPDMFRLRIPYPLSISIEDYISGVDVYNEINKK